MRALIILILFLMPAAAQSGDTAPESPRSFFEHMAFLEGSWQLENFLMTGPGQSTTKSFSVTTQRVFDGMGLMSNWVDNETGDWIGAVITTYDPQTQVYSVRFFDGRNNRWTQSDQTLTLTDTGFEASFSGEDAHGQFDSRTRMERLSGDHYRQTIERRYPGTDWFVTDSIDAQRD